LGALVADPDALGVVVPAAGPGTAVDRRTSGRATYVVLTLDGGTAVAGAAVVVVDVPPVRRLRVEAGRLLWDWPAGLTEVLVVWRADRPPTRPDDPGASRRKVTNTRYEIDGGAAPPPERPLHVAVFACTRDGSTLHPALVAPPDARVTLG
jgi:hypothetical protein